MAEPTYSITTERIYHRLPEFYRTLDAQHDFHLKKYISAIADELYDIEQLVARLENIPPAKLADYYATLDAYTTYVRPDGVEDPVLGFAPIGETSDLFDGRTADADWLPYIGQVIGADILSLNTEEDRRDAVIRNYLGFRAGSREALENAAKQVLTGEKYIRVYPHRDGAGDDIGHEGTEWDILLITKGSETPGGTAVVDEILRKGAKPAGVVLHHMTYSITWLNFETMYPSWSAVESNGVTWANIETGNAELLPV